MPVYHDNSKTKSDNYSTAFRGVPLCEIQVYECIAINSIQIYNIDRAVACGGQWGGGQSPPQNFPNFVKFLGKMAARRKFCIVGENLAPPDEIPKLRP